MATIYDAAKWRLHKIISSTANFKMNVKKLKIKAYKLVHLRWSAIV